MTSNKYTRNIPHVRKFLEKIFSLYWISSDWYRTRIFPSLRKKERKNNQQKLAHFRSPEKSPISNSFYKFLPLGPVTPTDVSNFPSSLSASKESPIPALLSNFHHSFSLQPNFCNSILPHLTSLPKIKVT